MAVLNTLNALTVSDRLRRWADPRAWHEDLHTDSGSAILAFGVTATDPQSLVEVRLESSGLIGDLRLGPDAAAAAPHTLAAALAQALERAQALVPEPYWNARSAHGGPQADSVAALWAEQVAATLAQRSAQRAALGLEPGTLLVLVAAQERNGEATVLTNPAALLEEVVHEGIPYDQARAVALDTFTKSGRYPRRDGRRFHAFHNGMIVAQDTDWRSLVIAADIVIGDATPPVCYAARIGKPVLYTTDGAAASRYLPGMDGPHTAVVDYRDPWASITAVLQRSQGDRTPLDAANASPEAEASGLEWILEASARWRNARDDTDTPAPLPVVEAALGGRSLGVWHQSANADATGTVQWERYPAKAYHRDRHVLVAAVDRKLPTLVGSAAILLDHERTVAETDVEAAASAILNAFPICRTVSLRTGPDTAAVFTRSDASWRVNAAAPLLDVIPGVAELADTTLPELRWGSGPTAATVTITTTRAPLWHHMRTASQDAYAERAVNEWHDHEHLTAVEVPFAEAYRASRYRGHHLYGAALESCPACLPSALDSAATDATEAAAALWLIERRTRTEHLADLLTGEGFSRELIGLLLADSQTDAGPLRHFLEALAPHERRSLLTDACTAMDRARPARRP